MKKNNFFLLAIVAVSALCACANNIDIEDVAEGPDSFVGYIDSDDVTKTTLEGVKVYWEDGDEIKVNGKNYVATVDSENPTRAIFNLKAGNTAPTGTLFRAAYPSGSYSSTSGSYQVLGTQTYAGENNISKINHMYAETYALNGTLHFKNVCGLIDIKLTGKGTVQSIAVTADKQINGTLLNMSISEAGALSYTGFQSYLGSTAKTTTLSMPKGGVALNATTPTHFHVALPEQDYTSLKIAVTTEDGTASMKTTRSFSILKNNIYHMPVFDVVVPELSFDGTIDVVKNEAVSKTKAEVSFKVTPKDKDSYYMVDFQPKTFVDKYATALDVAKACLTYSYATTLQQLIVSGDVFKGDSPEWTSAETIAPNTDYYAIAFAIDEDFNVSPAMLLPVKSAAYQRPAHTAVYSDYLGKWYLGANLITVTEKVNGESYTVTGLGESAFGISGFEAIFKDGWFSLFEQNTGVAWADAPAYNLSIDNNIYLTGIFGNAYNSYMGYPFDNLDPVEIFAGKYVDGAIIVDPGVINGYNMSGLGITVLENAADGEGGMLTDEIVLPASMPAYKEAPEALFGYWACDDTNYPDWELHIVNSDSGVLIDNFDIQLLDICPDGFTPWPAVAVWDESNSTLTVPDNTPCGLIDDKYDSYQWHGGDWFSGYTDIVFDVDLENKTISLASDGYCCETYSYYGTQYYAPLTFHKVEAAPAPIPTVVKSAATSERESVMMGTSAQKKEIKSGMVNRIIPITRKLK